LDFYNFLVDLQKNPRLFELLKQRIERIKDFEYDSSERDLVEPPQKRQKTSDGGDFAINNPELKS